MDTAEKINTGLHLDLDNINLVKVLANFNEVAYEKVNERLASYEKQDIDPKVEADLSEFVRKKKTGNRSTHKPKAKIRRQKCA